MKGWKEVLKLVTPFKADTIEELAEKIGVPVQNLVETVKDINAAADAGEDKLLGRPKQFLFKFSDKGPYYAMRGLRAFFQTLGGVRMNSKMQAMDKRKATLFLAYTQWEWIWVVCTTLVTISSIRDLQVVLV